MFAPSTRPLVLALALALAAPMAHAASFVYEGRLDDLGQPANGRYDLKLSAFGDAALGTTLAAPITFAGVEVKQGRFRLDVALPLVQADQVWLEVAVRGSGEPSFSAIPGRSKAIAAPLIGACWSTTGDSGVNPATNFIGTTDAQPFVVRTQNVPSLRIEPSTILFGGLPITTNTIAGSSDNNVTAGVRGATIAGGGVPSGSNDPNYNDENPNRVTDHYGTVGGGYANRAGDFAGTVSDSPFATVSGGRNNTASGGSSTVVGGGDNTASGEVSTVGGGAGNCAGGVFSWAGGLRAKVRPGTNPGGSGSCSGLTYPGGLGDGGTFIWADSQFANFVSTGNDQFLVRAAGGMAINTNTPAADTALTVNGNVALSTSGDLSFGSQTRQMLNLFGTGYGIGVQAGRMYFRANPAGGFAWFEGGVHAGSTDDPGASGSLRMRLTSGGQLQTTTGTIGTLSDVRLKDHIADFTDALDRVNALRPVTYRYAQAGKAAFQPEGRHLGFLAQEVQAVFPDWVSTDDDGHLMLSMRGFEALAVRAMQELSAENAALHADLEAMRAESAALRAGQERVAGELAELRALVYAKAMKR